jgi:hypothetical protein
LFESPAEAFALFRISFEVVLIRSLVPTAQGLEQGLDEPATQYYPYIQAMRCLKAYNLLVCDLSNFYQIIKINYIKKKREV